MANLLSKTRDFFLLVWRNVTIEPVIVLYLIAFGLNQVIRPNLLLDKACRQKHGFNETVCQNLNTDKAFSQEQIQVQQTVSEYEGTLGLLAFVPRILYTLTAGAWSDRHGRRILIALPIFGQFLVNVVFIVNYAFLTSLPFETLYLEFVNELCGNVVLYYLGVYSYIADITSDEERITRLSVVDGTDYIFTMVGTFSSGPLFGLLGYYAVFGSSAALALMAVGYIVFFVRESLPSKGAPAPRGREDREVDLLKEGNNVTGYGTGETEVKSNCCCQTYLPRPTDLIAGFATILRQRPQRPLLLLLVFNYACYIFTYNGTEGTHRYLFAQKKYGWDEQQFTVYLSVYRVGYLVTLWAFMPLLSKGLRLHDAAVAILSSASTIAGMLLPALLAPAWALYLGSLVSCLSPAATISIRAMASKSVNAADVGKVYAVLSFFAAVSSSLVSAGYQALYYATLPFFPGMFWIVNAALCLITVPGNVWLRRKLQ